MKDTFDEFTDRVNLIQVLDHAGRSGNGFFQTIFDEHPEVITCPWIHYVYSYILTIMGDSEWLDSRIVLQRWRAQQYFRLIHDEPDDAARTFIRKIGGDPDVELDRELVRQVFRDVVLKRPRIHRRDLVIATYYAYARGLGRDVNSIRYILTSDSISLRSESVSSGFSGKVVDNAVNDFPKAILIHLIRDPRAGFASTNHQFINQLGNMYGLHYGNTLVRLKRLFRLDYDWDSVFVFGFWLMYFRRTFEAMMRKREEYAGNFIQIRNEDLNLDFVNTMKSLSDLLQIEFLQEWQKGDEFQPTMVGRIWRGTGAYNSQYSRANLLPNDQKNISRSNAGPNRYVTERWKSRLSRREVALIETFLLPEFVNLGYPLQIVRSDRSTRQWLPYLMGSLNGEIPSWRWIKDGRNEGGIAVMFDRVWYVLLLPFFYFFSRLSFVCAVRKFRILPKE